MKERRNLTKYLMGTEDPLEGIRESEIFIRIAQMYEHLIAPPKPDLVRAGILDEGESPERVCLVDPADRFKGSILAGRVTKSDSPWIASEIGPDQLAAFVLGLGEYLCDDFGLKSKIKGPIRYPRDAQMGIIWSLEGTVLELGVDSDQYQKELTPEMIIQIRMICDVLLQSTQDFINLGAPLPRYILDKPERPKIIEWVLLAFSILVACLSRPLQEVGYNSLLQVAPYKNRRSNT